MRVQRFGVTNLSPCDLMRIIEEARPRYGRVSVRDDDDRFAERQPGMKPNETKHKDYGYGGKTAMDLKGFEPEWAFRQA